MTKNQILETIINLKIKEHIKINIKVHLSTSQLI